MGKCLVTYGSIDLFVVKGVEVVIEKRIFDLSSCAVGEGDTNMSRSERLGHHRLRGWDVLRPVPVRNSKFFGKSLIFGP